MGICVAGVSGVANLVVTRGGAGSNAPKSYGQYGLAMQKRPNLTHSLAWRPETAAQNKFTIPKKKILWWPQLFCCCNFFVVLGT